MSRAGIVTVVGKPNAGKSTLLNRIIGEKLSIVSPKPQSTRNRIVGIRTTDDTQMVILDTPGLLNPKYPLQSAMRSAAVASLHDADVIVYLVDGTDGNPPPLETIALLDRPPAAPSILAVNKADVLTPEAKDALLTVHPDAAFVSATTGAGVDALLERIVPLLPESPFLYAADDISTQTVRFFVSELIREATLEQLEDEVPYSIACEIEEYREAAAPVYIRAVLHVERESQKRILIGAGGRRIREIGTCARAKIEQLVGQSVYLDLWVKVLPNWRRNAQSLHRLGFHLPEDRRS